MKNNSKNGYSAFNAGSLNENNAAMTELWQSNYEMFLKEHRDFNLFLDEQDLHQQVCDMANILMVAVFEAAWCSMPTNVAHYTEFDICMQMGRGAYRGLKYAQIDRKVKDIIMYVFEHKFDLRKTSGQRKFFRTYLEWKRSL